MLPLSHMCVTTWCAYRRSSEMSLEPLKKLSGVASLDPITGCGSSTCIIAWTGAMSASSWDGETWPQEEDPSARSFSSTRWFSNNFYRFSSLQTHWRMLRQPTLYVSLLFVSHFLIIKQEKIYHNQRSRNNI